MDPLTLAGLGFTVAVTALLAGAHASKIRVPRQGVWDEPPDVLVTALCPVPIETVRSAVSRWRVLGHAFGQVVEVERAKAVRGAIVLCSRGEYEGLVVREFDTDHVGEAFVTVDGFEPSGPRDRRPPSFDAGGVVSVDKRTGLPEIHRAVLGFGERIGQEARDYELVVAHELGHALGYGHTETKVGPFKARKSGHLMHPKLRKAGWVTTGLEEGR